MPELIKELDYHIDIVGFDEAGAGPYGQRMIANPSGGQFEGDRLKGTITSGGGDWALLGADGFGRLDVRNTLRTVDGATIYLQSFGLIELTPGVMDVIGGSDTPTNFGEQYLFTTPRLETGDERYAWVNKTMFVAEGRLLPGPRIEFRLYRLANS